MSTLYDRGRFGPLATTISPRGGEYGWAVTKDGKPVAQGIARTEGAAERRAADAFRRALEGLANG